MAGLIALRGADAMAEALASTLRKLEPALLQHVLYSIRDMACDERLSRFRNLIVAADIPVNGTPTHLVGFLLRFSDPANLGVMRKPLDSKDGRYGRGAVPG